MDGGSTDATLERAQAGAQREGLDRAARQLRTRRRDACRYLQSARQSDRILSGDNEYRAADLFEVVRSLVRPGCRAVFGTRAVKCTDLSEALKEIYGNDRRLYLASKYGGILLSVMTLLLYNRYVTDVLSTLKGYDAELLHSLDLKSNGIDLETEIVSKLSRRREYMFEMPVEYRPRTREQGKKIRTGDGMKALLALIRFRMKQA